MSSEELITDLEDYKEKIIQQQGWICPVSQKATEVDQGQIIFVKQDDFFISNEGLKSLRERYGVTYINDKIVTRITIDGRELD